MCVVHLSTLTANTYQPWEFRIMEPLKFGKDGVLMADLVVSGAIIRVFSGLLKG